MTPAGIPRLAPTRIHPLEGGLAAWMALNFPVRAVQLPVAAATLARAACRPAPPRPSWCDRWPGLGSSAAGLDAPGWMDYPLASDTTLGGTHASLDR